jgi:hypothetical protein
MRNHTFAQLLKEEDDPMANWKREDFEKNDIWSYGVDASSLQEGFMASGMNAREAQEMTMNVWRYLDTTGMRRSPVVWNENKKGFEIGDVYRVAFEIIPEDIHWDENALIGFYYDKIWTIVMHDGDLPIFN